MSGSLWCGTSASCPEIAPFFEPPTSDNENSAAPRVADPMLHEPNLSFADLTTPLSISERIDYRRTSNSGHSASPLTGTGSRSSGLHTAG